MSCAIGGRSTGALGLNAGNTSLGRLDRGDPVPVGGPRSEPPISLPCAMAAMPADNEAPAATDEPPQVTALVPGVQVRPCSGLSVNPRNENSGVLVMPMMIAPASRRLAVTGESPGAMLFSKG